MGRLGGLLAPLAALLDGVWLSLPKLALWGIACWLPALPSCYQRQSRHSCQRPSKMWRGRGVCTGLCLCEHRHVGIWVPRSLMIKIQRGSHVSTCVYSVMCASVHGSMTCSVCIKVSMSPYLCVCPGRRGCVHTPSMPTVVDVLGMCGSSLVGVHVFACQELGAPRPASGAGWGGWLRG